MMSAIGSGVVTRILRRHRMKRTAERAGRSSFVMGHCRTLAWVSGVLLGQNTLSDSVRPTKPIPAFVRSQEPFDRLRSLEVQGSRVGDGPAGKRVLDLAAIDATDQRARSSRPREHGKGRIRCSPWVTF